MYTWGYIKENTLAKLNLTEEEANQQDFLSRFPYYANEAMTQICSAIKPNEKYFQIICTEETVGSLVTMPDDFIAFSDDIIKYTDVYGIVTEDVGDDSVEYCGYNQVRCKSIGIYDIPYNARWFFFTKTTANNEIISAPADILDALPSYMASQCMKIDDEVKASIFRNEYEMFLARIDNTSFKSQRTFHIGGGW